MSNSKITDELIDKRLEWLLTRVLTTRCDYFDNDQETAKQFYADMDAYNNAVNAYLESSKRYGREAPSLRKAEARWNQLRKVE